MNPSKAPLRYPTFVVIGAMRSARQMGSLLGLSFLANYSFFKRDEKEED